MARPIRDRMADVSVGGETSAQYFWLDVIPPRDERYDFIMRANFLHTHPWPQNFRMRRCLSLFDARARGLWGYNLKEAANMYDGQ